METNNFFRSATVSSNTWNRETREIEAIASTFADVQRSDARGVYMERLDATGLDISNIAGLPLLDGHARHSASNVIGHVVSGRIENNALIVRLKLSAAGDVADTVQKITEGSLRGVSIGYSVNKWAETVQQGSRVRSAADWRVIEISAVAIPADQGATFRSKEAIMPTENQVETEAREAVEGNEQQETRSAPVQEQVRINHHTRQADPVNQIQFRAEALAATMTGDNPSEGARLYMSASMADHARAAVEAAGVSTRAMNRDELFRAAMHTTSDFPALLQESGNRVLRGAYDAAQSPLKQLSRKTTHRDFRGKNVIGISGIGTLKKVSEAGEIQHVTRAEESLAYRIDTYGAMFSLSRQAIVNDDLGGFSDWARAAGRAAAETEASLMMDLLLSNPVQADGVATFDASHGNLMTGAALSVTALSEARKALRNMRAEDGTPISAAPRYLLVGPELETEAEQLLADLYAATTADVNPFASKLTLLVEPRLADDSWFVFASPSNIPFMEHAYLSGAEGPQVSSREGWEVLSREYRAYLDFGAAVIDWRGAVMNPGAA